jgi:hypothetical protein
MMTYTPPKKLRKPFVKGEIVHAGDEARAEATRLAERGRVLTMMLELAWGRMDRARDILTKGEPTPNCNWGMLNTALDRKALSAAPADVPSEMNAVERDLIEGMDGFLSHLKRVPERDHEFERWSWEAYQRGESCSTEEFLAEIKARKAKVTELVAWVRSKHNGYSAECREVMPTLAEPTSYVAAMEELFADYESDIDIAWSKYGEATSEIQRLEAEVCDLRKQNAAFMEADSKVMAVCMADNDRLEVENAELRAKLANGFGRNGPAPPLPSFVTDSMSQISDSEGE